MKLTIKYFPKMERAWLLKRENGLYEQHAHFYTKKDAINVRKLIDSNKYPYNKSYLIAVKRILTDDEFKKLKKKDRYINVNKGVKNGKRRNL